MKLRYTCPTCQRTISVFPLKELSRNSEKIFYQCVCPHCKAGCEVSTKNDEDMTPEEKQVFDEETKNKNTYFLGLN